MPWAQAGKREEGRRRDGQHQADRRGFSGEHGTTDEQAEASEHNPFAHIQSLEPMYQICMSDDGHTDERNPHVGGPFPLGHERTDGRGDA